MGKIGSLLGIGIATFNRRERLARLVAGLAEHTRSQCRIVIADDGSTDGSAEWCRENGLTVVTGPHHGVARNKDRALLALAALGCDPLILLEDDLVPTRPGWEDEWIRGTRLWHHLGYRHPKIAEHDLSGSGTAEDPILNRGWTAQCLSVSARVIESVGYLDPRFEGWGHEHGEWTNRIQRAGYGFREALLPDGRVVKVQLYLWGGIALEDAPSYRDNNQVAANLRLVERIADEPIFRRPWMTPAERSACLAEQLEAGIDASELADRLDRRYRADLIPV
jgi:glycosyltransferase involved in cell wall biosynthesis